MSELPYRANVGAALFAHDGRVLIGRRSDMPGDEMWQLPQGGIDEGEEPRAAVMRELAEEIGTCNAVILGEHPEWLSYDLPPELVGRVLGGRYRGQRQRWFALRFMGSDDEIRLDAHLPAEFDAWRWVELAQLAELPVGFKRDVYRVLVESFAPYARPVH